MLPTRERAGELLIEAEKCNPGTWGFPYCMRYKKMLETT